MTTHYMAVHDSYDYEGGSDVSHVFTTQEAAQKYVDAYNAAVAQGESYHSDSSDSAHVMPVEVLETAPRVMSLFYVNRSYSIEKRGHTARVRHFVVDDISLNARVRGSVQISAMNMACENPGKVFAHGFGNSEDEGMQTRSEWYSTSHSALNQTLEAENPLEHAYWII